MRLNDIHFHDSIIRQVTEDTAADTISFEVDYPVDWDTDTFEVRIITFTDVLEYSVHEGAFTGKPALLDWKVLENRDGRTLVRLETTAGYRTLSFKEVELRNAT